MTSPLCAICGIYLGLNALGTLPANTDQDELEGRAAVSPGASIVVGREGLVRPEFELGWRQWQIHGYSEQSADGDVNDVYGMANLWLSPPVAPVLYAGGGVGASYQRVDGSNGSQDHQQRQGSGVELAWQVGGGVRVPVRGLTLDVGYRRWTAGATEQHTALLGVSIPLGHNGGQK